MAISSGSSKTIDKTVSDLAAQSGLTNFNSPQAGKPVVMPTSSGNVFPWAPAGSGWRAGLPVDPRSGFPVAACVPTGVSAKLSGKSIPDGKLKARTDVGAASQVQASWGSPADILAAAGRIK